VNLVFDQILAPELLNACTKKKKRDWSHWLDQQAWRPLDISPVIESTRSLEKKNEKNKN
jgi:hypothetical protein